MQESFEDTEYLLTLMLFVIDNQNNFCSGLEVHGLNTRSRNQLYLPTTDLSVRFEVWYFFAACVSC
jgi:hypothetical protein